MTPLVALTLAPYPCPLTYYRRVPRNELLLQWKQTEQRTEPHIVPPHTASGPQISKRYLSVLGFSWGVSSGQALPSIRFLASAYSASRWARDLTCGVGLFGFMDDANDPLLAGRFKMRIWGGGPAGIELSWITMVVFNGDRAELLASLGRNKHAQTINLELKETTAFLRFNLSCLVSFL